MLPLVPVVLGGIARIAASSTIKGISSVAKKSTKKAANISSKVKSTYTPDDSSQDSKKVTQDKSQREDTPDYSSIIGQVLASGSKPTKDDAQAEIKQKKHNSFIENVLEKIKIATEKTAAASKKANKIQQNADFGKSGANWVKAGVSDVTEKISNASFGKKAALLGIFTGAIIALIKWWNSPEGPGSHSEGLVGWTIDLIKNWWTEFDTDKFFMDSAGLILKGLVKIGDFAFYLADKLTDWLIYDVDWSKFGKNILDTLQSIGDASLWIIDTALEGLFGTDWQKAKIFWSDHWRDLEEWWYKLANPIQRWWTEVEEWGGISKWVLSKIKGWWYDFIGGIDWPFGTEKIGKALLGNGAVDFRKDQLRIQKKLDQFDEQEKIKKSLRKKRYDKNREEQIVELSKQEFERTNNRVGNTYNTNKNLKNTSIDMSRINISKGHEVYEGTNKQPWMKVITSKYGTKESIRKGRAHSGIDFRAPVGTEITSITDGVVEPWQNDVRGGKLLVVRTNEGKRVLYMHLSKQLVKPGQKVTEGQPIASSGNTGKPKGGGTYAPHIHLGVKDANTGKTEDPLTYINSLQVTKKEGGIVENVGGTRVSVNNNTRIKGASTTINNESDRASIKAVAKATDEQINNLNAKVAELSADPGQATLMGTKVAIDA